MHRAEKNVREKINAGLGQGHGATYQPWLQMKRKGPPSHSNINFRYLPMISRHGHFMSRNEWNIAMWLLWLGVDDLREQFPLWPFPHPHPLYNHPRTVGHLPESRGTLAIAQDLGIEHGCYVGSDMPYVATTDFMLTLIKDDIPNAIAIAAKPADMVSGKIEAKDRIKERLVLEMAYADELGIPWKLLSDADIPLPLRENLELCLPASVLPATLGNQTDIHRFCQICSEFLHAGSPVGESIQVTVHRLKLTEEQGLGLFYHGLWQRYLPVDLRHPILMSRPAVLTDFVWAVEAANNLFGGGNG